LTGYITVIANFGTENILCCHDPFSAIASVSGFFGSSAIVMMSKNANAIFVDSRYTLQAIKECKKTKFEVVECKILNFFADEIKTWISKHIDTSNLTVNYFPHGLSVYFYNQLNELFSENKLIPSNIQSYNGNNKIFYNVIKYDTKYAGKSFKEKKKELIQRIDSDFYNESSENFAILITSRESIAWLFNLRASELYSYSPTFPSAALVFREHSFLLIPEDSAGFNFNDDEHVTVIQESPDLFADTLSSILQNFKSTALLYNERQTPYSLLASFSGHELVPIKDYCLEQRMEKCDIEVKNAQEIHKIEAVAIIRLLMWLEENTPKRKITEYDVAVKLEEFRKTSNLYKGQSFSSIVACGGNAAVVHYSPTKESCALVENGKVLLLDVGGHYLGGTTDMTRTVWLPGKRAPSKEIIDAYTDVLKGHIAVASGTFPNGTSGGQLDSLARQFLWRHRRDYAHSTGHGVGNYLAVHEGVCIAALSKVTLKENFILSNEPGFYKQNDFGIRLENMMVTQSFESSFLGFSQLTLVPFDSALIDFTQLTNAEKEWLEVYHKCLEKQLSLLSYEELEWLKSKTKQFTQWKKDHSS
jgi:Xaa-Pro aminopeptidase